MTRGQDYKPWTTTQMLVVCALIGVGLTVIFLPFPEIDLKVAHLFYNGDNDFWLRKSEFTRLKNTYMRDIIAVLAISGVLYYLYRRLTDPPHKIAQLARYGFFILCIILSTGLVVHTVFKDNWGRARPKYVMEFDGNRQFTPPLLPANQCDKNCSFVSGDASLGFVTIALALYARRRNFWVMMSVGTGLGFGLLRMMNGSHFLSDILYSGVFTCGTVLLLYRWIVEERWSEDMAWTKPILVGIGRRLPASPRLRRAMVRLRRAFGRFF